MSNRPDPELEPDPRRGRGKGRGRMASAVPAVAVMMVVFSDMVPGIDAGPTAPYCKGEVVRPGRPGLGKAMVEAGKSYTLDVTGSGAGCEVAEAVDQP